MTTSLRRIPAALVLGALFLTACGSTTSGTPIASSADAPVVTTSGDGSTGGCDMELWYTNGSLPPPHGYRIEVKVTDGAGTVTLLTAGESGGKQWSQELAVDADGCSAFDQAAKQTKDPTTGGPGAGVRPPGSSDGGGIDLDPEAILALIKQIAPQQLETLLADYEKWEASQR